MANLSYLRLWYKDFPEGAILDRFGAFLRTVPFSATRPGFTYVSIQAVDPSESPVLELDLRSSPLDAAGILDLAKDHIHSDCSYEVQTACDLNVWEAETNRWKLEPQALEIVCRAEDFDSGSWQENGHIEVNLGFEHLYTGHAGLLGTQSKESQLAESPAEARFMEMMAWPENLSRYQQKTQENIRKLWDWLRTVERLDDLERTQLWSEGEEDFEARLEDISAAK